MPAWPRTVPVTKDGALAALAASRPGVKGRGRDYALEAANAEVTRLSEAGRSRRGPVHRARSGGRQHAQARHRQPTPECCERRQVAAVEARAIKDDPTDLAEIRAIQQDLAALHEG